MSQAACCFLFFFFQCIDLQKCFAYTFLNCLFKLHSVTKWWSQLVCVGDFLCHQCTTPAAVHTFTAIKCDLPVKLVHTKQNSYCPFPISVFTVHLPSSFLSPLLVAVVFVRLGKITKRRFVRGCSCWNPTRSSWREKGAGGSTTPPYRSQNIRLQSCASLPHTHMHTHPQSTPTPPQHTHKQTLYHVKIQTQ